MTQKSLKTLLFVGLGNPGLDYSLTRHNLGFMVIEAFGRHLGWTLKEDRHLNVCVAKGMINSHILHLLMPLTYMNLSGDAVRRYVDYFKIPYSQILIICDDISLSFGQMRLKNMGSAGGHNGLKSIEASMGTVSYNRLRMGIGHPGEKMLASYVLENFSFTEQQQLKDFIGRGVQVLQRLLRESFSHVMTSVNTISRQEMSKEESGVKSVDLTKPPVIGRGE